MSTCWLSGRHQLADVFPMARYEAIGKPSANLSSKISCTRAIGKPSANFSLRKQPSGSHQQTWSLKTAISKPSAKLSHDHFKCKYHQVAISKQVTWQITAIFKYASGKNSWNCWWAFIGRFWWIFIKFFTFFVWFEDHRVTLNTHTKCYLHVLIIKGTIKGKLMKTLKMTISLVHGTILQFNLLNFNVIVI